MGYALTAVQTSVAAATSTTTLFAVAYPDENGGNGTNGRTVFNDSTATLYLLFGAGASTTDYTVQLAPGAYYEFPCANGMYCGEVDGIWSAVNGNARLTAW
jgi:hypothetical protein